MAGAADFAFLERRGARKRDGATAAKATIASGRRSEVLRKEAALGVDVLDRTPPVVVVKSESANAFRIAKVWDAIADELESEAGQ